jgi:hypothetical protein
VKAKVKTVNAAMTGDIEVLLRGGTYVRSSTLSFDATDSGSNSHFVLWSAYGSEVPVLSGAATLGTWTDIPGGLKQVTLAPGSKARQLFVNGLRAVRARGAVNPGWTSDATGINTGSTNLSAFQNQTGIEVVAFREWKMFRCPVQSIGPNRITMQQPCWTQASDTAAGGGCHPGYGVRPTNGVSWLENAREYLDQPGGLEAASRPRLSSAS